MILRMILVEFKEFVAGIIIIILALVAQILTGQQILMTCILNKTNGCIAQLVLDGFPQHK
jgi:hypothetical protein